MNKIGFNQKKHSKNYFTIIEWLKSMFRILLPLLLTISIIFCAFKFPQHKAWIIADGIPQDMNINNFTGRIDCTANIISSSNRFRGTILNQQSVLLNVYGEDFELKPGELKIVYGKNESNKNHWDSIASTSLIQLDMLDMKIANMNVKKSSFLQKFDDSPSIYTLSIIGYKDYIPMTMYGKDFQITFQGDLDVYIKDKIYKPDCPFFEMNFTNPDYSESQTIHFQLHDIDNMQLTTSIEKGRLLFTGECSNSKLFFESGDLKFNQTTSEKQYTLNEKELMINPVNEEKLKVAYSMKREKQFQIYGYTDSATLTGNSLFLTFNQWLIENTYTVVGTVIATFLGVIIVKKN